MENGRCSDGGGTAVRVAALSASGPDESKHERSLGDTPLLSTSMKTPEFAEKDRPRSTDDNKRTRVLQGGGSGAHARARQGARHRITRRTR